MEETTLYESSLAGISPSQISPDPSEVSLKAEGSFVTTRARIAVYDDFLSAPRIIDVDPSPVRDFIETIASRTYELAQQAGGNIPYTVIREITENFIHANFKECTISILNKGSVIRFSDQGPGIIKKDLVQKPGFTSATDEMRQFIRGVGSGFPIVKEYLSYQKGSLSIEDNIKTGAVITIAMESIEETSLRTNLRENESLEHEPIKNVDTFPLDEREKKVLLFLFEEGMAGPSDMVEPLGVSVATAYRVLEKMEKRGLIEQRDNRKRILSDQGFSLIQNL